MIITTYSFVMAILSNVLLILFVYLLRKTRLCLNFINIQTMVVLYLVCLVRLCVPIEIPKMHIIIGDETVYTKIIDALCYEINISSITITPIFILLIIWVLVSVVLMIRLVVKYNRVAKHFLSLKSEMDFSDNTILEQLKTELKLRQDINIICSEQISSPMCFGFFRKNILLPAQNYSERELYYIIRHELCHIKNKDIWIKLITEVYCILFWWNPIAYLLKTDLSNCLEMKCDYTALESSDDKERIAYYEVLLSSIKNISSSKSILATSLISCEFSRAEKKVLIERFNSILRTKQKSILTNTLTSLFVLLVLITSYIFIWQPVYHPTDEDIIGEDTDVIIIDRSNGYVLHKKDGSYWMIFEGAETLEAPVEAEDVLSGMYCYYDIIEEK